MKTFKVYLPVALVMCLFLSACATISYLGDTYPANEDVKVYYDAHDVKKEFKVIGHITSAVISNEENTKKEMIAKARSVGADAIIFKGLTFTGGKSSTPLEIADAIKYTDRDSTASTN